METSMKCTPSLVARPLIDEAAVKVRWLDMVVA